MSFEVLRALIEGSPTEQSAANALDTLVAVARDGNIDAAVVLVDLLHRALAGRAHPPLQEVPRTSGDLLESSLPPPLRVYAVLLQPRSILTLGPQLGELADDPIPEELFDGLKRLVATRSVVQHEALKVFVLCAVVQQRKLWVEMSMPAGARPSAIELVLNDTRIVEGDNADASFRFGRERILRLSRSGQFMTIVHHELGHHVFDSLVGRGKAGEGADDSWTEVVEAVPRLIAGATEMGPKPLAPGDRRAFRSTARVSVLCTLVEKEAGEYFHWSLTDDAGPIEVRRAASIAWGIVNTAGIDRSEAVAAYSSRGVFHFGYRRPAEPPRPAAPAHGGRPDGAAVDDWLRELRASRRFGRTEGDIGALLGVGPSPRIVYGVAADRAMSDMQLATKLASAPRFPTLNEEQASFVLAAAWRIGDPALLRYVLQHPLVSSHVRRSSGPQVAELGASLCAIGDEDGVTCYAAPVAALTTSLTILREYGTDLDRPAGDSGRTVLTFAAARPATTLRTLLECDLDVDRLDGLQEAALHVCAAANSIESATLLLDAGASVDIRDGLGDTPLHRACASDHAGFVRLLLGRGADPQLANRSGETPLMLARSAAVAESLCAAGAEVDAATTDGNTALMRAASHGCADVVKSLLAHGADHGRANHLGEVAQHHAVLAPAELARSCIEVLLDSGAEIDEETNEGVTPLMAAAGAALDAVVETLIARGANVNATTRSGATALLIASDGRNQWTRDFSFGERSAACLRRLVAAGADVNHANHDGITPLHAAMKGFDAARIELLLELGADPNVKTNDGTTPLMMARAKEHDSMIGALLAAGAKETHEP